MKKERKHLTNHRNKGMMNMMSKDLVIETLNFASPITIPRQLWSLPWAKNKHPDFFESYKKQFSDDIVAVEPFYEKRISFGGAKYDKGKYIDEWGCIFTNIMEGVQGEVKEPLLDNWSKAKNFEPPYSRLDIDKIKINKFCQQTEKFVLPQVVQRPFERMQFIRGTENLFIDLIEKPPGFIELLNKIHKFYLNEIAQWCKTEIDGIFLMDDWGSQNNLLIDPKLWRTLFKPLYKNYIELAHKHDKYVFMHSDGYIFDILPDLVEIGVDALNSQLFCMDIVKIGREFSGKITFWGEIDRQNILSFGEADDVFEAVKKVYLNLYEDGGVIAQCEFGPGAKPENVWRVFEAWSEIN